MKFFKIFFWDLMVILGPYGDFSDIKSSIRNTADDLNFVLQYFYQVKTQQQLVDG